MVVHLSHDWACNSGRWHGPTSCGDATLKSNWGLGSHNGNDHWQHEVTAGSGEVGIEWLSLWGRRG